MTTSKKLDVDVIKDSPAAMRDLVVVSGYYGFDNLGDEAILEELTSELKQLVKPEDIVVLSANPEQTSRLFGVKAVSRHDLIGLVKLIGQARLFVSGGGGLFQNTRSLGSVAFYGLQIMLAKLKGARVLVYAQGLGPFRGMLAERITAMVFSFVDAVSVRDLSSLKMIESWGIRGQMTADPVWCLNSRTLPGSVEEQLASLPSGRLVALSLRQSTNFTADHLKALAQAVLEAMPSGRHLVLVPLQKSQDESLLLQFALLLKEKGGQATFLDTSQLAYPSQWLALASRFEMVVGMRLHALIMALKAGVPVVGIAYDPKVEHLTEQFEQPCLILTKEGCVKLCVEAWQETLKTAFSEIDRLSQRAIKQAEAAKKLACQNINLLDRILNIQRDG